MGVFSNQCQENESTKYFMMVHFEMACLLFRYLNFFLIVERDSLMRLKSVLMIPANRWDVSLLALVDFNL
jgi:hypothetical protein